MVGRAVECGGLENRCGGNSTGGSNPSPSARKIKCPFCGHIIFVLRWLDLPPPAQATKSRGVRAAGERAPWRESEHGNPPETDRGLFPW